MRPDRQIELTAIEQIENFERAARLKLEQHLWSNLADACSQNPDQHNCRVIVDCDPKFSDRFGRVELGRLERLLQAVERRSDRDGSCSARGVGNMPLGLRMNRSSLSMWRSR